PSVSPPCLARHAGLLLPVLLLAISPAPSTAAPPVLLHSNPPRPSLPSFPTRRSSDLRTGQGLRPGHEEGRGAAGRSRFDRSPRLDRKSTRLNSSHVKISYAVFCLKQEMRTTPSDGDTFSAVIVAGRRPLGGKAQQAPP